MAVNSFNAQNPPVTTKGDVFTFSTVPTRLGVGANDTVLTADSSTATGLKWAAPAGGANWTLANAGGTALTAAQTITISGLSNVNKIFIVVDTASSASASSIIGVRLNADTGNNYNNWGMSINPGATYNAGAFLGTVNTAQSAYQLGRLSGNAGSAMQAYCFIDGCGTSGLKVIHSGSGSSTSSSNDQYNFVVGGYYNSSSVITSVSLFSYTGNFDNGTVYVYTSA